MIRRIDSHQHIWRVSERTYSWITPEYESLLRDFELGEIISELDDSVIVASVLIQAADTYEDTLFMVSQARSFPRVAGIVGWVPLDRPEEAAVALDLYGTIPIIKGIRNLTHDYADPRWIGKAECVETLTDLSMRNLSLDFVSTTPDHLDSLRTVATRIPRLRIVLDHMANPPIMGGDWNTWALQMREISELPNVWCKLSGLSTGSPKPWSAGMWQKSVDHCLSVFGPQRMMMGSDWPVLTLAGDFVSTWQAQEQTLELLGDGDRDYVLFHTAKSFYRLDSL
jgi:L-fuconolactonase